MNLSENLLEAKYGSPEKNIHLHLVETTQMIKVWDEKHDDLLREEKIYFKTIFTQS